LGGSPAYRALVLFTLSTSLRSYLFHWHSQDQQACATSPHKKQIWSKFVDLLADFVWNFQSSAGELANFWVLRVKRSAVVPVLFKQKQASGVRLHGPEKVSKLYISQNSDLVIQQISSMRYCLQ
jgi:hypothetical protein